MVDPVVDAAAHWMVGLATLLGVCAIAVGIVLWLRSWRPERLRIGEHLPPAIAAASALPNAHEIHREYRLALLRKCAISSIFLGASFLMVSLAALALLPSLQSSLAQISVASGEEFNEFATLPLSLFMGLAAIVIGVCSDIGRLVSFVWLPHQSERNNASVGQNRNGPLWREVIIIGAPIMFLWAVTLMYALSSTATWVYRPHVVALQGLLDRYPWIPFAIPFALLISTLVRALCVWRLNRLAPRRMASDAPVSVTADRLAREEATRSMNSSWWTAPFLPGFMQFMVVAQCFIPAFLTPTGDPFFVSVLPVVVWSGWFFFLFVLGAFVSNIRIGVAAAGR
jgi:hypothetical protein